LRLTHGLRAVTLATLVALTGVSALSMPVAAADPAPTATPDPAASPTPVPTATTDPAAAPAPVATPDPAATSTPLPTASPDPVATATPDPVATATPDSAAAVTPAALASPAPTAVAPGTDVAATLAPIAAAAVTTPAAVAKPSVGARIAAIALAQLRKRYVYGAAGPRAFDCSGLVRYAYLKAGVSRYIGGGHSALAMYRWARAHHLTSSSGPQIGDVVVYGGGTHVGIYIGRGRVVSALNPRLGIRITTLRGLTTRFTTFIHTRI
jgi:cell wall-associated NlpC family hydrolase